MMNLMRNNIITIAFITAKLNHYQNEMSIFNSCKHKAITKVTFLVNQFLT